MGEHGHGFAPEHGHSHEKVERPSLEKLMQNKASIERLLEFVAAQSSNPERSEQ